MAQQNWSYIDNRGQQYKIGLYHGDDSGHVIVYCDENIVIIDFSINKSKTYSFYVGDVLFELCLNKESQDTFQYEIKINSEISTPLNLVLKKENKRHNHLSIIFAFLFITAVSILVLYLIYYH